MVKLNKIYTRTGDDGTTGLVDGSRVSKTASRLHAIGEVDETNSALGLAIQSLAADEGDSPLVAELRRVQNDLFDLGADIATPGESFEPSPMELRIVASQVEWLEAAIDNANAQLPPLTSFILPGGSLPAAHMHMARVVTRRAERALVAASLDAAINPQALNYLNRLSDYLFTLCRLINASRGGDILWVPGASR
ncbi:MAG: ATP:cob(I)alamin adenosyltransferase [Sphingomonadales bacterium 17-56-6]|nr:MAG: ATP:cob(I)alamin adenosyltransferase [Sphingomonadales bacterium 28-55-16]OYZ85781.1 MAG: ATP:cob(I)alamin adenosyltransferase [Sphingomonadales bacterium 17-56-6]